MRVVPRLALGVTTVVLVGACVALISACVAQGSAVARPTSLPISCQPFAYSPAPVAFSFTLGPVASSAAEQTAVDLFRACELPTSTITGLTATTSATAGARDGPNVGQAVWLVRVDATVRESSQVATYESHFLIEVNQTTGVPTVIAYG